MFSRAIGHVFTNRISCCCAGGGGCRGRADILLGERLRLVCTESLSIIHRFPNFVIRYRFHTLKYKIIGTKRIFLLYLLVDQWSYLTKTVRFRYGYDVRTSTISLFYFTHFFEIALKDEDRGQFLNQF